ncbi:hypothetical protein RclHR1_19240007 [Rhizophagus clarus]|uniref:Uncharacterized protein n=1 Tax=Rhizophagus clarus TaxID=94130 RepID=A0A2Z6QP60_9GLOM|nr:hypothetical protein RclHR1_19240007 [Rhizophagus clarus]
MFHSDYKHIIDRLPESLVKRACERLLHYSKDPVPLESISRKSERIESYLRCTLEVYENSLNKKKRKLWPKKNYCIHKAGQNHDYEEDNNCWVINELKVLFQHLLDYNRQTFGKFMQDIEKDYRKRISMNKKLRCKNEDLKMKLLEAEKELASMKSNSSY